MEQETLQSKDDNVFGQLLKQARLARSLSLEQVARRLGVSKVSVWSWEKGKVRPRKQMLRPLSEALEISEEIVTAAVSPAVGVKLSDVVSKCQEVISAYAGVERDSVEIIIKFAGREDGP